MTGWKISDFRRTRPKGDYVCANTLGIWESETSRFPTTHLRKNLAHTHTPARIYINLTGTSFLFHYAKGCPRKESAFVDRALVLFYQNTSHLFSRHTIGLPWRIYSFFSTPLFLSFALFHFTRKLRPRENRKIKWINRNKCARIIPIVTISHCSYWKSPILRSTREYFSN